MSPHQPHDKLFKAGFSDPETTAGFLCGQLPEAIVHAIDWSSLALQPGSFIDSQFRQSESDLLFHARSVDHPIAFYLLFEHQTTEDAQLALRLLRYMVRIWEHHLKSHPEESLPVILPVVLAQNDRSWSLKPDFSSLLDIPPALHPHLRPFIPDFAFRIIQLAEMPFDAIVGTPAGIMILRTLKAERSGDLLADPVWDEAMLAEIPSALFEMILAYLWEASLDPQALECRLDSIRNTTVRQTAMTYAQKLRHEGRQEGRQDAILANLEIRLGPVSEGLVEAVREVTDPARLDVLQRASVTCADFEEFAAQL